MKKASDILKHMFQPFENKLNRYRCLKKIISLMPANYKKYVINAEYKGDTLHIVVSHPALRQEIYYRQKIVFDIIKNMHKLGMCKCINPKNIKTHDKYSPVKKRAVPKEIKFYLHDTKDFEIKAKNPQIIKKFEEIKKLLKGN